MCPLVAEWDDAGNLLKLTSDRDHPVSKGFACHKGLSFTQVNDDPDRLNFPLRRSRPRDALDGGFERVSWDAALDETASRLLDIQDKYGPNSIAVYAGNPLGFNSRAINRGYTFAQTLGTVYSFNANTQDLNNKFAASQHLFGSHESIVPDLLNTEFFIGFGCNPKISKGALFSHPNAMKSLKDIKRRGGKVLFVNPRKIESANAATGEVLQIKPDTDIYLMAALLHELEGLGAIDQKFIRAHCRNIEGLQLLYSRYPAERVAGVTGIAAAEIKQLAREIANASSVAFYMSTGVNQGRQGTLAYWLLCMLTVVTGNFGRQGGTYKPVSWAPSAKRIDPSPIFDSPVGPIEPVWGTMPATVLADLIEDKDQPIRALFNIAGNPLLSMSGEDRLKQAFGKLEFIASVDIYQSDTSAMSDIIMPATDWLERADINLVSIGTQLHPYLQYTEAMVEPGYERKEDGWIMQEIAQRMGKLSAAPPDDQGWKVVDMLLGRKGLSREQLAEAPHGTIALPSDDPWEQTFGHVVQTDDKKIDCCPAAFADALATCEELFQQLEKDAPDALKIISLRTLHMHNSWMSNVPQMRVEKHAMNPLHINPEDAAARGLQQGQRVKVYNEHGSIETEIQLSDELLKGVVAMSHGYGHRHAPSMKIAHELSGANPNRLLPVGAGSFEALSNMSWMNGVPVEISALGQVR
ncbi:formate dehydrogenase [gamma proteobacterium BDW918]|jgi:anaerobic selenocysteine-containing dehydrogenase|nr:formate dehydrogenase [gamma proteobacterium BDW918]RLP52212.1 MAG: formate dehydrogenase [Ketobacter sp.]|tara:strand:+ start:2630 stop:4708 length:2079 start_codon:yes stop_codon:yes gene_type:complete